MNPSGGSAGWILVALFVLAALFVFARKTRDAPPSAIGAGLVTLASGLITAALSAAHLVVVLIVALGRSPLVYDFRLYSLVLLGVVLTGLGLLLALAASGLVRGDPPRTRLARNAALMLLLVNAPLAPLQGFAVALAALAAVTLAAVFVRARMTPPPAAP
jgi:hypothetical protein